MAKPHKSPISRIKHDIIIDPAAIKRITREHYK